MKIETTFKELLVIANEPNQLDRIMMVGDLLHQRNAKWLMDLRPGWEPKSKLYPE